APLRPRQTAPRSWRRGRRPDPIYRCRSSGGWDVRCPWPKYGLFESAKSKHNVFDPYSFSRVNVLHALPNGAETVHANTLLLGVDGGGTRCRVRLCAPTGAKLGEATGGPPAHPLRPPPS